MFKIPEDEYSSGHRDDQCWAKIYGRTEKEAKAKKKKYFDTYPVRGYNTEVRYSDWINLEGGGRCYYINIARWHSCD